MRWKEQLYERPLRRPLDDSTRRAIEVLYLERRHEIRVATELHWNPAHPAFTLRSQWLSFHGRFTTDTLVVEAELSLAAKMMVTAAHRADAVRFIDSIARELDL